MGETAKQLLPHETLLLNEQLLALNLDVASTDLCNVACHVTQDNTLYYSSHYRRVKAKNNYTVKFKDVGGSAQYGQIQFFVFMSGHVFTFIVKLAMKPESCQAIQQPPKMYNTSMRIQFTRKTSVAVYI